MKVRWFAFGLWFVFSGSVHGQTPARPNILVVLTDDLAYSDIGPYGGEIPTPNLNQLASDGLAFRNFYVTPRCSTTRASLLTGLQSHAIGLPGLANNMASLDKNHVMIPEVLRGVGYRTYMSEKWHLGLTDNFGSIDANSPRDPRVRGFDHFWGFTDSHSADNFNQEDGYRLLSTEIPTRTYAPGVDGQPGEFYQTDATTDYALDFIQHNRTQNTAQGTDDPFFLHVAYGAPHVPLQARDEWIEPLVPTYEAGWDVLREERLARMKATGMLDASVSLSPPSDVRHNPPNQPDTTHPVMLWDELAADRQDDLARRMAIYAAMVERVDHNLGRVISDLEANGELDNTLILFLSDNGPNAENHEFGKKKSEEPRTGAHTFSQTAKRSDPLAKVLRIQLQESLMALGVPPIAKSVLFSEHAEIMADSRDNPPSPPCWR